MLELASLGAKVLHNRSVELAKKYGVELVVRSSLTRAEGTIVKEDIKVEKMLVSGVAADKDIARIAVLGIKDEPGKAFMLFSLLAKKGINVDIILQSVGRDGTTSSIQVPTRHDSRCHAHLVLTRRVPPRRDAPGHHS